jgi:DNA-damage-inducible protein J
MGSTTMVHVRVDEKVKEEACATLAKMGLSVSGTHALICSERASARAELPQ